MSKANKGPRCKNLMSASVVRMLLCRFYIFFPTLLCGVIVFFAAPPRSAFRVPPSSSLLQPLSHNISHNNITQTTSHTQRLAYNITHTTSLSTTTSLTQHLSQQHHSDNIPHTTSRIQHHSHNISHNNISHTTAHTHNIGCQGVGCTPLYYNISHNNITQRTSHTQRLTHNSTHTT